MQAVCLMFTFSFADFSHELLINFTDGSFPLQRRVLHRRCLTLSHSNKVCRSSAAPDWTTVAWVKMIASAWESESHELRITVAAFVFWNLNVCKRSTQTASHIGAGLLNSDQRQQLLLSRLRGQAAVWSGRLFRLFRTGGKRNFAVKLKKNPNPAHLVTLLDNEHNKKKSTSISG